MKSLGEFLREIFEETPAHNKFLQEDFQKKRLSWKYWNQMNSKKYEWRFSRPLSRQCSHLHTVPKWPGPVQQTAGDPETIKKNKPKRKIVKEGKLASNEKQKKKKQVWSRLRNRKPACLSRQRYINIFLGPYTRRRFRRLDGSTFKENQEEELAVSRQ